MSGVSNRVRYPELPPGFDSLLLQYWAELIRALEHRDIVNEAMIDQIDGAGTSTGLITVDGGRADELYLSDMIIDGGEADTEF